MILDLNKINSSNYDSTESGDEVGVGPSGGLRLDLNKIKLQDNTGLLYAKNAYSDSKSNYEEPTSILGLMYQDASRAKNRIFGEVEDLAKSIVSEAQTDSGLSKVKTGLGETALNFGASAVSFLPSVLSNLATTGIGKALQTVQVIEGDEDVIPSENIAKRAKQVGEAVGSFLPNLLPEVKTETGKAGTKLISDVFETAFKPLKTAEEFYAKYGWPNLGNIVNIASQLLVLKGAHRIGGRAVESLKDILGKEKVSEASVVGALDNVLKENPELNNLVRDRLQKNQQIIDASEGFSAIDLPRAEPTLPTKSELSQRSRGFEEGGVRIPSKAEDGLTASGKPGTVEEVKIGGRPELVETIPRTSYKIGEDGKPIKVEDVSARKEFKIDQFGKPQLVEEIPGQKQVWKIVVDPLKNESGAVSLDLLIKTFGWGIKGSDLFNRLKKHISETDLELSGIKQFLMYYQDKRIDYKKFKELIEDYSPVIQKKVLSNDYVDFKTRYNELSERLKKLNEVINSEGTFKQFKTEERKKLLEERSYLEAKLINLRINPPNIKTEHRNSPFKPAKFNETYSENLYNFEPSKPFYKGRKAHFPNEKPVNNLAFARVYDSYKFKLRDKVEDSRHIHEVQSDWMNDVRKEAGIEREIERLAELSKFTPKRNVYTKKYNLDTIGQLIYNVDQLMRQGKLDTIKGQDIIIKMNKYLYNIEEPKFTQPPLKESWYKSVLRDQISQAVREGKDSITMSTADVHKAAWDWTGERGYNYEPIYDGKYKKFLENELGVKAERIGEGEGSLWHFPLTDKVKEMYKKGETFEYGYSTVGELLLRPFMNERGEINIGKSSKEIREKFNQVEIDKIIQVGKLAERNKTTIEKLLEGQGLSKKQVNDIVKVHESLKVVDPFKMAGESPLKYIEGADPIEFKAGDVRVNTSKLSNPSVPIGLETLKAIKVAAVPITGKLFKPFIPTIHTIDKFKSQFVKDLWHRANAAEVAMNKDMNNIVKTIRDIEKEFPNAKLREQAGIKQMMRSESGAKAMKKLNKTAPKTIKYDKLMERIEPIFESLFNKINEVRVSIGLEPIKAIRDAEGNNIYLPFIAQESFMGKVRDLLKGSKEEIELPNLITDSLNEIIHRHDLGTVEKTAFEFTKRGGLKPGVVLELDPVKLLGEYSKVALRHIHMSPINSFIKEIVSRSLKDPESGKVYKMKEIGGNPELAEFLSRWSNKLAGVPNVILGESLRPLEKAFTKLSENLTTSILGGSVRTILVQPVSLLNTMSVFGPVRTAKGLVDTVIGRKFNDAPIGKSNVLKGRIGDPILDVVAQQFGAGRFKKGVETVKQTSMWPMKMVDYIMAEATWRTAYNSVKGRMSEIQAIKFADETVVRTQGSGKASDLSPIQMNGFGKAMTLWQTFTINNAQFIAREVLGINHPERNPLDTARRVVYFTVGTALINNFYEDYLGIQSPSPAPIKAIVDGLEKGDETSAIVLKTLKEVSEAMPFGGSVKFGSHPFGPGIEFIGEIFKQLNKQDGYSDDLITRAIGGDDKARLKLAEMIGKVTGVPGTGQAVKFMRGKMRGEDNLGALLGRYDEDKKGKKGLPERRR